MSLHLKRVYKFYALHYAIFLIEYINYASRDSPVRSQISATYTNAKLHPNCNYIWDISAYVVWHNTLHHNRASNYLYATVSIIALKVPANLVCRNT